MQNIQGGVKMTLVSTPRLDVCYRSYEQLPHRPVGPRPTGALMSPYDDRTPPPGGGGGARL
jgi:hypothetical protein